MKYLIIQKDGNRINQWIRKIRNSNRKKEINNKENKKFPNQGSQKYILSKTLFFPTKIIMKLIYKIFNINTKDACKLQLGKIK